MAPEFSQCLAVFHWRHSAYVLELPLNGRKILDSGNVQQIPLRVSLFNRYNKLPFLLGHFLAKFEKVGISVPEGKK